MGAFEDFVTLELPRRSAFLTVEIAGYDGDPNHPDAPAILDGAPKGTWYLRETPNDIYYRKGSDGSWAEVGGGGGGEAEFDIIYSLEDLGATVDYNDVDAVDPPAGKFFSTQTEIDDFLSANGATAFKHLSKLWDALPAFIFHSVTINIAAGVQRPHPDVTDIAFNFGGKIIARDGSVTVAGSANSADWTDVVSAQTVTSHQTLGDYDPWVAVSGTPFPTDGSLKGLFAVLSTGQKALIHDHDANTLYLTPEISPAPVDGVTTVRVCRPGTILRNSLDDATAKANPTCVEASSDGVTISNWIQFQDLMIEEFGVTWGFTASHTSLFIYLINVLWDHAYQYDSFSVVASRAIQVDTLNLYGWPISVRSRDTISTNSPIYLSRDAWVLLVNSVFTGSRYGIWIDERSQVTTYFTVVDGVGWITSTDAKGAVMLMLDALFLNQHGNFPGLRGKRSTFRAGSSTESAFWVEGAKTLFGDGFTVGVWFEGYSAPCVRLSGGGNHLGLARATVGLVDGGGNTDVGIEVNGARNTIQLDAYTDLAGIVGQLRMEGIVGDYDDLPGSDAPLVTQLLNVASRG